ncbi:MAG TPA: two-component regulator propeller domain-containing protein, partial [Ohtaekwangia sp.]|nr:two-component regulator propeller domain-containing protein [Ohtaekwangia sp.]
MWLGTGTGLVRYDGTEVYRYEHVPGNKTTITDNKINAIIEDKNDNLWIGTAQGLVIYNRERDNFINVDSISGNRNYLNGKYVSALCSDRKGRIWIGTLGQGINIYDPKEFTFTHFKDSTSNNIISPTNYVLSLYLVDSAVWVGTKGGLKLLDVHSLKTAPLSISDQSITSKEITQVKQDGVGNIWLATIDMEIIKLFKQNKFYRIDKTILRRNTFPGAESNILTISIDENNNVWAAGEKSGLNYLNTTTNEVICYEPEEGNPRKLPTNSIRAIYVDDTGIVWVGTYNRGAYMIDSKAKRFTSYGRSEFLRAGFTGNNVRDIAEDNDGNIWIVCDGGGLGKLDVKTNKIHYDKEINNMVGTPYLSALLLDDDKNIWIGTLGRGVFRVNIKTREVRHFNIESNGFGDNKISCLYEDSRNIIWAGSVGSGLFYFDHNLATFVPLNEEQNADYVRKSAYVTSILEDADSALWIGTYFGLYRLRHGEFDGYKVTLYTKDNQPGGIGSYDIQTIHEDQKRNLWFGTGDNGMAVLSYHSATFDKVQKQNGLVSNVIRAIITDRNGDVWISSNMGLMKYNPITNLFSNYTKEDGLPSNEFNTHTCLAAHDGKFYFGSDQGLVAFHPDSIYSNSKKPGIYFTDLRLNNRSVKIEDPNSPLKKHISLSSEIQLSYGQRSFAIGFAAINYRRSSRSQYCYKLEGFDNDWNCVGSTNRATYTNMDPGHYVLLVKAFNNDGISSEAPARLDITILQAPWKTWWAILLYLLLITSTVYYLIKIRIEKIKIKSQLQLERLAHEKEHELSESKTHFFTNVSHEFRTPLTLMMMPLDSIMANEDLEQPMKERLNTIRTSAGKMLRLVNELLDFNKLESSKLRLQVTNGDLVQFITDVASVFHDLAAKRNIQFGIDSTVGSLEGWFDHDKLEKIVTNLLSNAFKFTPNGGQINVMINSKDSILGDDQKKFSSVELTVIDNGIGISEEELPFIFDKFFQAKSSFKIANPGTGIGLSLTKGLVELHQGSINVESIPGSETKFVIVLPIDRQAYNDQDISGAPGYMITSNGVSKIDSAEDEDLHTAQILLVEDNDELRKYISLELRQQFTVHEAKDGQEGLDLAYEKSPDLIISDILMPFKNGIDLCKEVKSNLKTSHIPFILLTAKAMLDDQIKGISMGADLYITKPFNIRFLIAHVNQIIASRQQLYARFS